ncbi:acylneuraminate cytidylyltransferase family protein [Shewanella sp. 10N.7]|uniref:acylneuraminate cytidylyltransferase family protein n=1 Tax=Shewanella sp. 10N.7 TaxID=2885093 RepID=UPI001E59EC77|nr:acylneuraminate cytidylyltransferase family protein [Shewanella sp. 10N.7]MCC4831109.1 acylneuraminate cytidylyltransferase family protein [Shewanella sp. 10N.7]
MFKNKKILAIIPARGGSKRLPRKNILNLMGKPLIAWSILAAKDSKYIDKLLISTDDIDIANISNKFGAQVPELRPEELATDKATTKDVILYTLNNFGKHFDVVVILQPTSPLRNSLHIDEALEVYMAKSASSVISVTPCEHPPCWSNTLPHNGSMKGFIKPANVKRSQDYSQSYRLNGAIYIYDINSFINEKDISYTEHSFSYVMDNESSIDIDTELDFKFAEFYLRCKAGG